MSKIKSFEQFWPVYLGEHSHPVNRLLHFLGTGLGLAVAGYSVWTGWWIGIALALVCGYTFAWVGHFLIEKNRPATFTHPLYSFVGDFKMFFAILLRRL